MSLSLDRHASNASAGLPPAVVAGAAAPEISSAGKAAGGEGKRFRHWLRRAAGAILPREQVAKCGQKALSSVVTLHHHEGRSFFGGVETCGSVWMCPVCAAKITEGRTSS